MENSGLGWDEKQSVFAKEMEMCAQLVQEVRVLENAEIFAEPVDPIALNIPDYYQIIKHPMDLQTVEKKILANRYGNAYDFYEDLKLIFQNCCEYNDNPSSFYHQVGLNFLKICATKFKKIEKLSEAQQISKCSTENRAALEDILSRINARELIKLLTYLNGLGVNVVSLGENGSFHVLLNEIDDKIANAIILHCNQKQTRHVQQQQQFTTRRKNSKKVQLESGTLVTRSPLAHAKVYIHFFLLILFLQYNNPRS